MFALLNVNVNGDSFNKCLVFEHLLNFFGLQTPNFNVKNSQNQLIGRAAIVFVSSWMQTSLKIVSANLIL